MSNGLTVVEATEADLAILASLDLSVGGLDNLEDGDIGMPPRLRISQPTRPVQVDGKDAPGVLYNSLTGENWESLEIVILMFLTHTRLKWPEEYSSENDPMCKSDNGQYPTGGTDMESGSCKDCVFSQWGENGEKPSCGKQRNFLVWLVESEEAVILTLSSSALKVAKKLSSMAMQTGIKKSINMSLVLNDEPSGRWYSPTFRAGEKFTTKQLVKLAEVKAEMANLVIVADENDVVDAPVHNAVPRTDTLDSELSF